MYIYVCMYTHTFMYTNAALHPTKEEPASAAGTAGGANRGTGHDDFFMATICEMTLDLFLDMTHPDETHMTQFIWILHDHI